ncbi:non-ribosomal peptide synthase/polyketide synthase [Pseudomonas sp. NPDC087612]|uniref:non-ribosomal peptide synthase/polyketide synthase n=1 Tax=Pseudomonas sp. NPDC087612 TaxID=3364441 RepID=UPI0038246722
MLEQRMLALAERFTRFSAAERRALQARMLEQGLSLESLPIPRREDPSEATPASHAQQRMWFLWQLEPDSTAYNQLAVLRLRGQLNVESLRQSFEALVTRHEVLRTRFVLQDGQVLQQVEAVARFELQLLDFSGENGQALADQEIERQARQAFDLEQGPLLRATLLRLDAEQHVLLFCTHHIVCDAWSLPILVEEVTHGYARLVADAEQAVPAPLAVQYADHARWQRLWLDAGEAQRQLAYWKANLGEEAVNLELPLDYPRPASRSARGARVPIALSESVSQAVRAFAASMGATPFMVLLASFQAVLHRYSGASDIRIGTPIANRTRAEVEPLIGFFVNTQVLRAQVDGQMSFVELVQQAKQRVLEAQAHQDLPFEHLVDALQPQRSLNQSPLFQVMFNHQVAQPAVDQWRLPGLTVEALDRGSDTVRFDLTLNTEDQGGVLKASLAYACDLFEPATIERLGEHWRYLLERCLAEPHQRLAEQSLFDDTQTRQLLDACNDPQASVPACLLSLIAEQVATRPQATALVFAEATLSYAQLDAQANRLAQRLRASGVGPDVLVGIAVERSMALVVAVLAVLKAGGAYVPLDPEYPRERLAYMIEDSGIALLLSQAPVLSRLPADLPLPVQLLDDPSLAQCSDQPLPIVQQAENLAYLIYTSGSTGRPKAAGNRYGALSGRLQWMRDTYAMSPADAVLQKTSSSFDVSVWELLLPLTCGAPVVLAQPGDQRDPERLLALIQAHQVSTLHFVPSMLQAFIETPGLEGCTSLRNLFSGGEALSRELQHKVLQRLPHVALYNRYGPVEATINASHSQRATAGDTRVGIGRPLVDTALYVLGGGLEVLAPAAIGELYIGGAALARGYHRRPGLTAERFVPDPFGRSPGARLYRSGDLVRRGADGELQFVTRIDHQVKIRGMRVELGEIESQLLALVPVREAVVLAVDGSLGKQLVAYVVADAGTPPSQLREQLQAVLPDYMVPAHVVLLDQLPVTANGKLDRMALPQPGLERAQEDYQAPANELEQRIATIWEAVLKRQAIGRQDNFFELGGDSIISIQVVSRARQAGIHFTPRDLFQQQTVQGLASVARLGGVQRFEQAPVVGEVPLLPIAQAFFEQSLQAPGHWNQSVLLQPRAPLQAELLEQVLQALVVHHDALRLNFQRQADGSWQATYGALTRLPAALLWQADVADEQALTARCNEVQRSLDLQHGPLLRGLLATLADGSQRLLLVVHHLAVDGVSWRLLLEDIQQAYQQLMAGQALRLQDKTSSLKAWSERLQVRARERRMDTELAYWREQLSCANDLPCRDPQASLLASHARSVQTRLDSTVTRQLLQQAPAAYRTQINDLLLTALARVISRWTGDRHTLIRLEGHGREALFDDIDLSRTLGWFTSVFALRLTACDDLGQSIKQIKEQLRQVPDKGIGYGLLRYLADEPTRLQLRGLAQPRITFNYLGQFDASFADGQGLFVPSTEDKGEERSPQALLSNWLTLNGQVYAGELSLEWTFSEQMFERAQMQALADEYADELRSLISHCCDPRHRGVTPSDFALARLSQAQLDRLACNGADIEDLYPLSPMQQGMFFHSLYEQGSGDYINQLRVDIRGLDLQRFRDAWQACLQAHEVLRSGFIWPDDADKPVQVVLKQVELPFEVLDWRGRPGSAQDLQELADTERARGFELSCAPLLRLLLVRSGEHDYHLIHTSHHILMDGWSSSLLMGEVLQRYQGHAVPARPGRYADYIGWLQAQDDARSRVFWEAQLSDLAAPTLLAPALAGAHGQAASGQGQYQASLTPAQSARLSEFARQQKVTLNTLVQAAWLVLLQRYTGQPSVALGATVAGRPAELAGIEQQVGLFINTLPVIASPAAELSVGHWLQQVQAQNVALREHEQVPLADIQRWAGRAGEPLFDSILVFENYPIADALQQGAPEGLQFGEVQMQEQTHFALTLAVGLGEVLTLQFSYDRALCDDTAVTNLCGHLTQLLQGFVEQVDQPLGQLPMLGECAQRQVIDGWNHTAQHYADSRCVHQVIADQAQRTPAATALVFAGQAMSYAALELQANQWAQRLVGAGVGPEVLVGIAAERSLEMVVGLLAVLKAGGAYVPLDPDYPAERLSYMIEDSGIGLLLTQSALLERLSLPGSLQTLLLDQPEALTPAQGMAPVPCTPDAQNLAYVIYTSGSTGKPKGAGNRHVALSNRLNWMQQAYGLTPDDVVLQKTPFSFDVSVWEFFWPLMFGARLVIAEPGDHRDPARLVALIRNQGVSTLHFVPSMLQAFMQDEAVACCTSLKRIVCSGEALPVDAQAQVFAQLPGAALYNLYGPTEAAIDVTHWTCREEPGDSVPIGEPIANLQTWILDASLQLLPAGVIGELYLGGEGLARGYHLRPGLTAERFVASPFDAAQRLYRTGDLARYRADGVIEYAGRIDHQVKIRGLRIELGEIEARLVEHASVREAAVLAVGDNAAQRLVAYVVPSADFASAQAEQGAWRQALDQHLKANLPDYMVPARIQLIERMPLSPNGKLERKALPAPDLEPSQQYVAPVAELERQIAQIWQSVLKCERVGLTDNFFELGGDSIISIQVVSRARQAGIHFTPKQLFQHQTVQSLAAVAATGAAALEIDQGPASGRVQLLPIQAQFFEQDMQTRQHWNQSVLLKPAERLQAPALEQALQALVQHHDALRLNFSAADGQWRADYRSLQQQAQHWRREGLLWQASVHDQSELAAACERAQCSLDLAQGPLLRALLLDLPDQQQRLLLVIHHLVVDGVSWRILFEDLQAAYASALAGTPGNLPAKTSSVQAWAARLQRYAQSEAVRGQVDYWQAQLSVAGSALPCDDPDASLHSRYAHSVVTRLDAGLTRQLLQVAPNAYRTQVNDVLLAALARVIARWSGQADTLIQLEGHGREDLFDDIDLTRSVGWFTSLFPVRLSARDDLGTTLKTVKEQLRAIPDKGLGYGVLGHFAEPGDRARLTGLAVPRITFNYLGQFDSSFTDDAALFTPTGEARGAEQGADVPLANWLMLNGRVFDGELSIGWTFSTQMFAASTVQRLADDYEQELAALVAHCCDPRSQGATPSDFALAQLTQAQLDQLDLSAVEDLYPLSPMQQGMLFHALDGREQGSYVNQMSVEVFGLDVEAFAAAWQATVQAHDILRTRFIWQGVGARPLQAVQASVEVPFTVLDWRQRADLDEALGALAASERKRGFDLGCAPLLRLHVVHCDGQRYQLIYTSHHILMDGWSNSQLMGEVLQRYRGEQPAALHGRYRDYIQWLQAQDEQASEAFWKAQLQDLVGPTRLAASTAHDAGNRHQREYRHVLEGSRSQRLHGFAREQKVTFNTLVQAAWALLLQSYSGQQTVVFGATVAGRPVELPDAERQMGLFINTLPVATTPRPEQSVGSFLQALQAKNLSLREHEHTPLFDIQRWAGHSAESLFDNILVFENYPVSQALEQGATQDLRFGRLNSHEQTHYPLTLLVSTGEELVLQFNYACALFSDAQIERLASHLDNLLEQLCQAPQRVLGELDMLTGNERGLLLETCNSNTLAFAHQRCIHQHIEAQAARRADATALIDGQAHISYAQLNQRANLLACALIELGVGPEVRVGVAMPRSSEMLVALLAVLKAGGAYVPLDPDYPAERVAYMLEDSRARVLLSQQQVLEHLSVPASVQVVPVERGYGEQAATTPGNPQTAVSAQNLAYVIYTSGSTGKPKGVAITHRNVGALIQWSQQVYSQEDIQGVLASTSICFDLSVWELFVTLANGGQVIMARNALELPTLAARERVRLLNSVPSAVAALQRAGQIPPGVRIVNLAGEPLRQALVEQLYASGTIEHVYDLYGPSEDTTYSTWTRRHPGGTPSIGRPLANTRAYVVDGRLQPTALGVAGELLLAGDGVTRGYLLRPGLTAEKFVPDPFGVPGARLYRSGDLVRYRDDGELEYIGRLDHQVKIRGFRIELGEVEARLQALAQVREAAVLALQGARGAHLVAYLVVDGDLAPSAYAQAGEAIRHALRADLPDYMIPAHVLFLEQLPLTPNGKLDRKALPAVDSQVGSSEFIAPSTELACQVAQIWQQVLQVERIGMNDNFFEMGGHSLLVVSVVSRIQLELGMKLTAQTVFQFPVLGALVAELEQSGSSLNSDKLSRLDALLDEMEAI